MRFLLLDPLRGVAALWVFCFHMEFSNSFQQTFPALHSIVRRGELGVPMFFVISGYCITAAAVGTLRGNKPVTEFIRRRLWRIYPPFWCSIVVTAVTPFLIEWLSSLKTGHYVAPSAAHVNYGYLAYSPADWLRLTTLTQVFQPIPGVSSLQAKFTTINAVYWTLAIEVQFYLAVALAVAARAWFIPVMVVTTAFSFGSLWINGIELTGIFLPYWPAFAIGSGMYGVLTVLQTTAWRTSQSALAVGIAGATLLPASLIAAILIGLPIEPIPFAIGFATFLIGLSLLDTTFESHCVRSHWIALRMLTAVIVAIGAMSYSLYLLHGRLRFLVMMPLRQVVPVDSMAFDLGVLVLTSALCYVFYLCCERPFIPVKRPVRTPDPLPEGSETRELSNKLPSSASA